MFDSQGQCAQLLSFRKMTISLFAEYILSYIFLKRTNTLLFTPSSIFYITTKKHFPFALFAPNYLMQTLISLTSLFWYAKICCNFSSLIFTTQKSNQDLVFETETYICSEVLYVWFTKAQSVWGSG